ncbi:ABC transporter substrate-binding protein [Jonesiaceae bacterium BS-20]|uniref:ABC transporter substrate-binding protein n=1 Tax=Jonesiaceae bacterium BS-20 TaxID=3120821 RepID=A0AAU7DV30_9MICO
MKRFMKLVALAAVGSVALAGCSGGDSSASGGDGPIKLSFWHGYTEADGKVLDGIVADFNASQDRITIETTTKTWAVIGDTLLPALSANDGPDIVAMPAENLPVYASKGAFQDLDSFYGDAKIQGASINEHAVAMGQVDGKHYGLPTGFVPLSVIYNKTLFADAGIAEFPTTWDEWLEVSKQLTVDTNGDGTPEQFGLVLPDHATVGNGVWASLFYGNGGTITQDGQAVVNSDQNKETLKLWADAVINDKISPTGVDGVGADKLFSSGKAAMEIGGPWMSYVAQENNIDYAIAAVPAGPETAAASAIGISAAITAHAGDDQKAAALEFFEYFYSKDVATQWSLGSGWPPLRTDITAADVSENPVVHALTEIADTARPLLPGVINTGDVFTAVDEATQKALAGGDPSALLDEAAGKIQATLDK